MESREIRLVTAHRSMHLSLVGCVTRGGGRRDAAPSTRESWYFTAAVREMVAGTCVGGGGAIMFFCEI